MELKRILTSLIGFPLVVLLIVFGTAPIIDFAIMLIALICMDEYLNVVSKICKPIKWIAYFSTIIIFLVSILSIEVIKNIILYSIPIILLILFLHIILTDMKTTLKDVAYTLLRNSIYNRIYFIFRINCNRIQRKTYARVYNNDSMGNRCICIYSR